MRKIPAYIKQRLDAAIQTKAAGSAPYLDCRICRPTTPLTDNTYLEKQTVSAGGYQDASVAVCHPAFGASNTRIYIAYIDNGTVKVKSAKTRVRMDAHIWEDEDFTATGDSVATAFDGTMPKNIRGEIEFITEFQPWIFWTNAGVLYAQKLNTAMEPVILAESNCTAVSAIRATVSQAGSFDFGLCVFFILSGSVYYRQLIDGVWYDAELVSALPAGNWVDISAQRTWDYRIALQVIDSGGNIYELFSQYQGIGKQNAEHIELRKIRASADLTAIKHRDATAKEHIELAQARMSAPYGGLYAIGQPSIQSAYNEDDGTGNYGKRLVVAFDKHLKADTVSASATAFSITDSGGNIYTASEAVLGPDGLTVTLTFADFNNAGNGMLDLNYTADALTTMADYTVNDLSAEFYAANLSPSGIPVPTVSRIYNVSPDGTDIYIEFDSDIVTPDVAENSAHFTVTIPEYDFIPGGTVSDNGRAVIQVSQHDSATILLHFAEGNINSLQNAAGDITVSYAGGNLMGVGGAVAAFTKTFTPVGLIYKGDQNDAEHIEIANISSTGILTAIRHSDAQASSEHIEIANISAVGKLTHIDDI